MSDSRRTERPSEHRAQERVDTETASRLGRSVRDALTNEATSNLPPDMLKLVMSIKL